MVVRRGRSALAMLGVGLIAWGIGAGSAQAYTVKQTSAGAVVRWHLTDVAMRIDPSIRELLPSVSMENVVTKATGAWHGLSGAPELVLNAGEPGPRGYSGGDANNGVYLVKDWELQENALAVTVATFETDTGRIVDADVLVNANHPFGLLPDGPDSSSTVYDIESVLTHEMGHVLGLGESYDVRQATMWPSVATGETHQRDLDDDDQEGIEDAYSAGPLSEAQSPAGCGGASVVVRRGRSPIPSAYRWLLVGAAGLALLYWARARGTLNGPSRLGVPAFALVMLFGAAPLSGSSDTIPVENERIDVLRTLALRRASHGERAKGLARSVRSESARVRLAAAAVLERVGAHDDLPLASKLLLDGDAEVRRVAGRALERLRTAPPAQAVERETPEAQRRLGRLLRGASAVVKGEVVSVGVEERGGLHWSRFLVHGPSDVVEVQIPGGTIGRISQIVSEQEPPNDGDTVVVALHEKGAHNWALARDGVVYGGTLGEGPAIHWVP